MSKYIYKQKGAYNVSGGYSKYDVVWYPLDGNFYCAMKDHPAPETPGAVVALPSDDGVNWVLFQDVAQGMNGDMAAALSAAAGGLRNLPTLSGEAVNIDRYTATGYHMIPLNTAITTSYTMPPASIASAGIAARKLDVYSMNGGGVVIQRLSTVPYNVNTKYEEYIRVQSGGVGAKAWNPWVSVISENQDAMFVNHPAMQENATVNIDTYTQSGYVFIPRTTTLTSGTAGSEVPQEIAATGNSRQMRIYNFDNGGIIVQEISLVSYTSDDPTLRYSRTRSGPAGEANKVWRAWKNDVDNAGEQALEKIDGLNPGVYDKTISEVTSSYQPQSGESGVKLKVMAYNVAQFFFNPQTEAWTQKIASVSGKLTNLKKMLWTESPDFVGTQEEINYIDGTSVPTGTKTGNNYIWNANYKTNYKDTANTAYNAVHYKGDFISFQDIQGTVGGASVTPAAVVLSEVGGKKLWMVSAHLSWLDDNNARRTKQEGELALIKAFIDANVAADDYLIIAGDFNTGAQSADMSLLSTWCASAGLQMANGNYIGWTSTFHNDFFAMDNILVNANVRIDGFRVLKNWYADLYSDHYPVVAEVTLLGAVEDSVSDYVENTARSTPNYASGANLKERFGTAEAFIQALRNENYKNFSVGDYWPVTLNGTFRDYGSYTVPQWTIYYNDTALTDEAGTTTTQVEGQYHSGTVVKLRVGGTDYYCATSVCLPYYERTLSNEVVNLEIAGVNNYWRYGDSGELTGNKPHVTFVSRDGLSVLLNIRKGDGVWDNASETNPWRGSALFNTLNNPDGGIVKLIQATDIGAYLYSGPSGDGMRAKMETKASGVTSPTGSAWADRGKLFLPFEPEIWGHAVCGGASAYSLGCGLQMPGFNGTGRHISKGRGNGESRTTWWTASTQEGSAAAFCVIGADGAPGFDVSDKHAAPVCFVAM